MKWLGALLALPALLVSWGSSSPAWAQLPLATTTEDFRLPGTQPLAITDDIAIPSACTPCHAGYNQPQVEPFRNWSGSMMAQAGRDPLWRAALAVANQDAAHSGETCLRCHMPKGWLEGRSTPNDGSATTADDRQGVQCGVCHRLVDPFPGAENPPEDTAILAALSAPVPVLGNAMMVVDPLDRLRGPFDIVADLGLDPHAPSRSTLISPFHESSELCGTCHNLRNPVFTYNAMTGAYELNALDAPGDPALGFPEQSTYDEWAASEYASTGVFAPQFGINQDVVSTCQHCHFPDVTGRDANLGVLRDDMPLHAMVGGNTFIPDVLPHHPAFGAEVDASVLQEAIGKATSMLRRAASVSAELAGGSLTVRVTNESGHKLPTGYPEGRRMWLHVRAFDGDRNVVFESGRYVFSTATLAGFHADPNDPDYDPTLHVWEAAYGISPDVAAATGLAAGQTSHLVLNNVRLFDNRIPPRGFTNATFEAFDGAPVGQAYADGQYWDDVVYPVGPSAEQAEVTLYYQTASREYVEFLRNENTTNAAGNILFDLWNDYNKSVPVEMAHVFVESDAKVVTQCRKALSRMLARFRKKHLKEWTRCFDAEVKGLSCDAGRRDAKIAAAEAKLREKIGGVKDRKCGGRSLTPGTLGHAAVCPPPCSSVILFDMNDLASCAVCMAKALDDTALDAAYGATPPVVPGTLPSGAQSCQRSLSKAAAGLALGWSRALDRCELANANGKNVPPLDCATDPDGQIAKAQAKAGAKIATCGDFSGLAGCATSGDAAGTQACMESAIGGLVPGVTGVAYP
jgi:Cytochrome c554 and c-prime